MTFDQSIDVTVALSQYRHRMIENWIEAYRVYPVNMSKWAERIRNINDAQIAFEKFYFTFRASVVE